MAIEYLLSRILIHIDISLSEILPENHGERYIDLL